MRLLHRLKHTNCRLRIAMAEAGHRGRVPSPTMAEDAASSACCAALVRCFFPYVPFPFEIFREPPVGSERAGANVADSDDIFISFYSHFGHYCLLGSPLRFYDI